MDYQIVTIFRERFKKNAEDVVQTQHEALHGQ